MNKEVVFTVKGRQLIATLGAEIDHHTASKMRALIDRELLTKRPDSLILDFSDVGFMDSSGIGLILGRVESALAIGASVRVCGMSQHILKLMRLSGLDRVKNLTVMKSNEREEIFK